MDVINTVYGRKISFKLSLYKYIVKIWKKGSSFISRANKTIRNKPISNGTVVIFHQILVNILYAITIKIYLIVLIIFTIYVFFIQFMPLQLPCTANVLYIICTTRTYMVDLKHMVIKQKNKIIIKQYCTRNNFTLILLSYSCMKKMNGMDTVKIFVRKSCKGIKKRYFYVFE